MPFSFRSAAQASAVAVRCGLARITSSDVLAAVIAATVLVIVFRVAGDYGAGFDDYVQDTYGRAILRWYQTWGQDRTAVEFMDLYYYGGLFDTIAALGEVFHPKHAAVVRQVLGGMFGLAGLVGVYACGRRLGGPLAGVIGLALLAVTPGWFGTMFINPKDVPFAAALVWAVYAAIRILEHGPRAPLRWVALFGLCAGLAMAVRIGALVIFAALALALAVHALVRGTTVRAVVADGLRAVLRIGVPSLAIAWLVMLPFWPYAQTDPIGHPLETLRHFSELARTADIDSLFLGQEISDSFNPAYYLPVYVLVKLPEVGLALLCLAALAAILSLSRRVRSFDPRYIPVVFLVAFPIVWAAVTEARLYDTGRHFIFILPALAILAGCGAALLIRAAAARHRAVAALVLLSIAAGLGWQVQALVDLHPYEYTYYNQLAGGLPGAADRFDTDYWGTSLREALLALAARITADEPFPDRVYDVAICGNEEQVRAELPWFLRLVPAYEPADFYLATTRHHCERDRNGEVIVEVGRQGVAFGVVKDLRPDPLDVARR